MNKQLMSILLILSYPLTALGDQSQQNDQFNLPLEKGSKIERLTNDLGLNEAEKAKVEAIINEEKTKFRAFSKEERSQMQNVLTPEQITGFDAIAKEHRKKSTKTLEGGNNQQ